MDYPAKIGPHLDIYLKKNKNIFTPRTYFKTFCFYKQINEKIS